jgi:hypothetical protein
MEYVIQSDMAGVTLGDIRVMTEVLKKLLPEHKTKDTVYPNNYIPHKDRKLFCSCGHVVEHGKLTAHLKTKVKHGKGDAEGKAFLDRVAEYITSL